MDLELAEGRKATVTGRLDYLEVHAYAGQSGDRRSSIYSLPAPDSRVEERLPTRLLRPSSSFENLPQVDLVEGGLFSPATG